MILKDRAVLEDLRDPDFYARIPESLIYDKDAPHTAIRLYGVLDRHLSKARKVAYPGFRRIQDLTGMGMTTISDAIKYLENNRYLAIDRVGGMENVYRLMEVRQGKDALLKQERSASETGAVGAPETGAKPKVKSERRESKQDPLTRAFTDLWNQQYLDVFKKPYKFAGEKDWKATQAILAYLRKAFGDGYMDGFYLERVTVWMRVAWLSEKVARDKYLVLAVKHIAGFNSVLNQLDLPMPGSQGGTIGKKVSA